MVWVNVQWHHNTSVIYPSLINIISLNSKMDVVHIYIFLYLCACIGTHRYGERRSSKHTALGDLNASMNYLLHLTYIDIHT